MRLAEIRVGDEYAVSVTEKQAGYRALSGVPRHYDGYQARVVALETSETGRTVVRVELPVRRTRWKEWVEDNGDGTRTVWKGYVIDAAGNGLEDEEPIEALVQPSQVKLEWTEAVVRWEVRHASRTLDAQDDGRGWARYFGDADA